MNERLKAEIDRFVKTMDDVPPLPGFPRFRFGGSAAVAQLLKIAEESDKQTEATLNDPSIPREGRPTLVNQQRQEARQKVAAWQQKHLPALDAEIATAIPPPVRPVMAPQWLAEVWRSLAAVPDGMLDAFYGDAPPEVAGALEEAPPRVTVSSGGVPFIRPRVSDAARAARAYRDAPQEAKDRHDGLTEIRGGLGRLAAVLARKLSEEA